MSTKEREPYLERLMNLRNVFTIDTVNGKVGMVHGQVSSNDWDIFEEYFKKFEEESLWDFRYFQLIEHGIKIVSQEQLDDILRVKNIDYVIHGHVNVKRPVIAQNRIYIDTGKLSKRLTLLEISNENGLIYHQ